MARLILQISYDILPERREGFLALAEEMKAHFVGELKKSYGMFELKGKKNSYVEQFVCSSKEEFDALEDDMNERSEELLQRLNEFVVDGKVRTATFVEM